MPQLTAAESRELAAKDPLVIRDVDLALAVLEREPVIAFDLETSGLSPWLDKVAVVALNGAASGTTAVIHCRGAVPQRLIDLMNTPGRLFIGHNIANFDLPFLVRHGLDVHRATWYDTLVGEGVCKLTNRRDVRFSLKASALRQLGVRLDKSIEHSGWMNPELSDTQLEYVTGDVKFIHELRTAQLTKLAEHGMSAAMDVEQSLVPAVVGLKMNGLPIDLDRLADHLSGEEDRSREALYNLWDTFGPINPGSSQQVRAALATAGLDIMSTSAETLGELIASGADQAGLLQDIITARRAKKRTNMYDAAWIAQHVAPDGRIHPGYWWTATDTGRFSSSGPNMQQWPKNMRWVIAAPPGHRFLQADYKSAEVVVAAALANDRALLRAYESGYDLHSSVGGQVFGCTPDQVTEEQRKLAKAMNFCLLFGGWYETFHQYARLAGSQITVEEAQRIEQRYFATYTGIAAMKEKARYQSRRGGPVMMRLPTGLRRNLIPSSSGRVASTKILNTAVQGTAAAGMKFALLEADRRGLIAEGLGATVHDEIAGAIPEQRAREVAGELDECMVLGMREAVGRMLPTADCPISVDVKLGDDWRKS